MRQPELMGDQAEGLRRLLARSSAQVVTVVGARAGLGATSVVVNLAAAWTRGGHDVLVLDEHATPGNVANLLGLRPRWDVLDVVHGDKALHEALLHSEDGIHVLPVARAMQSLPRLSGRERNALMQILLAAANGRDVLLVDAAARAGHSVSTALSSDAPLLLVLNPTASGITESYSMLKQMVLEQRRRAFGIVVNKAASEQEARAVFANMAEVAGRHLQVRLHYAGYIPVDESIPRATQLRQPVLTVWPEASAAQALVRVATGLCAAASGGFDEVMQRLVRQAQRVMPAMA